MAPPVGTDKNHEISSDAQIALSKEVESTVMPILQKLKDIRLDGLNDTRQLIKILETNLQHIVNNYGHPNNLAAIYQRLTPVEILVASMVRQGLSTHIIAEALHISAGTVSIHRKHIRKKLGLQNKATNLQSYLHSLVE